MNDLISVVIPVYNAQMYLQKCLDSLLNQTHKNLEIICVNDGSCDNSLDILRKYEKEDKRIIIIDKENGGPSAARNAGLKAGRGDYVMFVDSDDWVDADMCQTMHTALVQNHADACMCCYVKEFKNHSLVSEIFSEDCIFEGEFYRKNFLEKLIGIKDEDLKTPHRSDVLVSVGMQLFKTEYVRDIQFVDTKEIGTAEDWLFQLEFYTKCNSVIYINRPFYHYRKTNEVSFTYNYKKDLYKKWMNLYDNVISILKKRDIYEEYEHVLNNKYAVTILFLGLNEIKSNRGMFTQAKRLKQILKTERYTKAYKELSLRHFSLVWKLFFLFAKLKMTFLMVCMLCVIEYLRTHKRS